MTDSTREARTVSVTIGRPPKTVYDYLADPARIPEWSFVDSIEPAGDGRWTAAIGDQTVTMVFAPPNGFGVLDQDVELSPGQWLHVPMRVVPNGSGSEVVFVSFRQSQYTDDDYDADIATVREDLARVKAILEAS